MADGKEVEEVSFEEEDSFANNQWELAYSTLLEKYKKIKHDSKSLKRKIELYVHYASPYFECVMPKEEIEKLNDKLASCLELENSAKNVENLEKNNASLVVEMVKLKSLIRQISEENEKLKIDMSAYLTENSELKETTSRLIKGK